MPRHQTRAVPGVVLNAHVYDPGDLSLGLREDSLIARASEVRLRQQKLACVHHHLGGQRQEASAAK